MLQSNAIPVPSRSRRQIAPAVVTAGVLVIVSLLMLLPHAPLRRRAPVATIAGASASARPAPYGARCFIQFYLGSLAVMEGADPYRPLETLGSGVESYRFDDALPFVHPPTSLLPYLPMALLPLRAAIAAHSAIIIFALAACGWLWGAWLAPGRRGVRVILAFAWILWFPWLNLLGTGQNTHWVLIALTGWLYAMSTPHPSKRRDLIAGALLACAIVKPHIGLLPVALALATSLRLKRGWLIAGALATGTLWVCLWTLIAPHSWSQFYQQLRTMPVEQFFPATIDGLLRKTVFASADASAIVRRVDLLIWLASCAIAALVGWLSAPRDNPRGRFACICYACIATVALCPHAYDYDFILLYPAVSLTLILFHRSAGMIAFAPLLAWVAISFGYLATKRIFLDEAALWWIPWTAGVLTSVILFLSQRPRPAEVPDQPLSAAS